MQMKWVFRKVYVNKTYFRIRWPFVDSALAWTADAGMNFISKRPFYLRNFLLFSLGDKIILRQI